MRERLWGTLSAGLVVPPAVAKDPTVGQAVERATVDLRYGAVCVNAWSGCLFAFGSPPWATFTAGVAGCTTHPITMMPRRDAG